VVTHTAIAHRGEEATTSNGIEGDEGLRQTVICGDIQRSARL
jgi:hypothetical protein